MKKFVLLAALICVIPSFSLPQERGGGSGAQAVQASRMQKVDQLFRQWDKPDSPGCALGVIKDGQFVYQRGYGSANLDHNIPITSKSVFYVGSMSKQFTAMSIALLVKQGKLSLDDDMRKYLPEMPRYQSPITIRHLIHHTSGLRDFIVLMEMAGFSTGVVRSDVEAYETMARTTNEEVFKLITRQKGLNFAPGEEYSYCNSNYILLGEVVKRVSGKSLPEFAEENIFKPLGMVNTHYYDDLFVVIKNRATGYSPREGGGFVPVPANNGTVGPAGVLTTVEDLLLWDRNFYQNKLGGGDQGLIDLVLTPDKLNDGTELHYAFGLYNYKYKGLDAVGHDGGFFGFKTSMNRFPEQRFTVICLCNSRNAPMDTLADQVADIYLADQFKQNTAPAKAATQKPISLTGPELAKFVGIYWNPITEGLWMLSLKDGNLIDPGGGGSVLVPIGQNRFQLTGQPVELIFETPSEVGHPVRMLKVTRGGKPQVYEAVGSVRPSLAQLAEYEGKFRSDEIDAAYTLIVQDGKLTLAREKAKNVALTPTFADNFWNDEFGYLKFTRDQRHKVNGLLYTSSWIRRLPFKKT
jgi:CubicO group peptidase (beta-lactamase class C family)